MRGGKKWLIIIVVALLLTSKGSAQNAMRIHYKNGFISEFPISEVDSITFPKIVLTNKKTPCLVLGYGVMQKRATMSY